jgi:hypothetical protein
MPNPQPWNQGAQVISVMTTFYGMYQLVKTGGNFEKASQAARFEGIFMSGFKVGATGRPPNLASSYSGVLTSVNSISTNAGNDCK